ncbi:hypothetical protein EV122DRAFT_181257, partial [Schizophyllum commune]
TPTKRARIWRMRDFERDENGHPKTWARIGREIGVSAQTAHRNYDMIALLKDPYYNNRKGRAGRPPRWPGEMKKTMLAAMEHVITTGEAQDGADIQRLVCPDVPKSTVRRYLNQIGLRGCERWQKPALKPEH